MNLNNNIGRIKKFYLKNERYISIAAFLAGFIWDAFTLRRIDLPYENFVFIFHFSVILAAVVFINIYDSGRMKNRFFLRFAPFLPIFIQFSFGGLFSAFVVFYIKSGSVFASWPFFILLISLFVGNEFFRRKYLKLTFQLSVFFIALFSYSVFILPVILNKMGAVIFLLSGFAALGAISLVIFLFFLLIPERTRQNLKPLILSISSIYLIFQLLYFTNIIPPVPLSLKESGVFHSIEKTTEKNYIYKVEYEPTPWYLFFKKQNSDFHYLKNEAVYCYSAVFAPTDLNVKIFHRWSYFDENKNKWTEKARLSLPVFGGRDGGYRGYSYIKNVKPGKWRVDVITEQEQILGRIKFKIVDSDSLPPLKTDFR